ncbi:MAG: GAF domain-containing sensor histidine kinase [Desulfatiglandaceae bacterium]
MELGYKLVREQLFFRKELVERVYWFIRLRWIGALVGLAGGWIIYLFRQSMPMVPLSCILGAVLLYNAVFLHVWKQLRHRAHPGVKRFVVFAHIQISLDLLALFVAIFFTGGISSPLLIFIIFYIILAGILLSPFSCYMYCLVVTAALAGLTLLQTCRAVPVCPAAFQSPLIPCGFEYPEMIFPILTFAAAVFVTAFLVTSVSLSLKEKGRKILRVSKDLEQNNIKLTALYEMVKNMGLYSDLDELMDMATRSAARIMGVRGCSIKLLDSSGKTLSFASTFGLSEDYVAKGTIDVEKSPVNRRIVQGSVFSIGKIDEKEYFQYPEDIEKEGISSMVCLPLRVEKAVLGVFCVYSDVSYYFVDGDVKFFSLMADLTALAIENLRSETNKTWFLHKAAHQLRSPLNAIYSMLEVLEKGYLGPLENRQIENISRCRLRLEMLGDMVTDLLKLGIRRGQDETRSLKKMNINETLNSIWETYRVQTEEKGIQLIVRPGEKLPPVMGDEKLFEDLFSNLVSNAIKYTPPGGKIEVQTSLYPDGRVRLEVSDTGIGIPPRDIPRLFTEFFRAENAKETAEEGTGLGMVIVKEIVDNLRGTISVDSEVGKGTTFVCLFPGQWR